VGILRGVEPRAVIAEVVEVGAVDDVVETPRAPLLFGDLVKLALAVKAPVVALAT